MKPWQSDLRLIATRGIIFLAVIFAIWMILSWLGVESRMSFFGKEGT